jgi:hypothetical protein
MEGVAVLRRAQEAGLVVWLDGSDVLIECDPTPEALAAIEIVKEHKEEVVTYLRQYGDGQLPPLDRPPVTNEETRRLIDYLGNDENFKQWMENLMRDESTDY